MPQIRTEPVNITVGTAGHIDHGKTSLVKCLTGCDTDRLKEEKERGMSIELGFAPCRVGDLQLGIVDVPGHENFIKTMVAGATGIDACLLVVAADDGIMPQTREHMDILTLLGVRRGLVGLTKMDRVDPGRLEGVQAELRDYLRGTFLHQAPVIPVSNTTGEGIGALYEALAALVRTTPPRRTDGVFRLPVERAFSAKGYGTVVCGVPLAGTARVGDEVVLLPQNLRGRVKAIQVFKRAADVVLAGQCTAMNIPHLEYGAIERGHVLAAPGYFEPCSWCVGLLRLLEQETTPVKSGMRIKLHTGTSELLAAAYPLEGGRVDPGGKALVQFRTASPLIAGPGDPFIVRSLSPARTVGGGTLIDTLPQRLRRHCPPSPERLQARAAVVGDDRALTECLLLDAPEWAAREADLRVRAKILPARLRSILDELQSAGLAILLGADRWIHARTAGVLEERLLQAVGAFHAVSPSSPGMTGEELRAATDLSRDIAEALVLRLKAQGRLTQRNHRLALPRHREQLPAEDQRLFDAMEACFRQRPFNPPDEAELAAALQASPADVRRLLAVLMEHERLIRAPEGILFHREAVDRARQILVSTLQEEGRLESVRWKYLLNTSRKYALPLLDYFDRIGLTRRLNNTRYLRT